MFHPMPYKSSRQEKFFNANRAKLEAQGVNVGEWNAASKGKKLPASAADGNHAKQSAKRGKHDC